MNDTEKKTTTEGAERPAGAAEAVTHEPAQEAAEKPAEGNTGVYRRRGITCFASTSRQRTGTGS